MTELHDLTAIELREALRRGETDPVAVAEHFLARIHAHRSLGAFATVSAERALARARLVRDEVPQNAPLWGMPIADKDLWQRAGQPTRFGSAAFVDYRPEFSDDVVLDLDAAGTVSLGTSTAPEFGLPCYTEPLVGPIARNPYRTTHTAGGSSGGAAVAVAARMLPFAPGSDGGGSVRIPAACCGLVGIKPTRGLLPSGSGIDSLGGLVVNGALARTVADAAFLLEGMRTPPGRPRHPYALRAPELSRSLVQSAQGSGKRCRIGVCVSSPWSDEYAVGTDRESLSALTAARAALLRLGHDVEDLGPIEVPGYSTAFKTIWQAGAVSIPVTPEQFRALEPLTAWLIERGRERSARDVVEAIALFTRFERILLGLFAPYDAVLTPALAKAPPPIGSFDPADAELNFAQQVAFTPFTSMVNVIGAPALVLPVELTSAGLPMAVQLVGRPGGEPTLVEIAAELEDELPPQPVLYP